MVNFTSYGKHSTFSQHSGYAMDRKIIVSSWNAPCILRRDENTGLRAAYNSAYKHQVSDFGDYVRYLKQRNVRYNYIR